MALIHLSSPHVSKANSTARVMRLVLVAMLPALLALTFFFGWGSLIHIFLACTFALIFEAFALYLRQRSLRFFLSDGSALVTAVLLALAIPPMAPWWITAVGMFSAIVIAKHLYGGLGQNPFNPAMVAYALLLISFPIEMTQWNAPFVLLGDSWQALPSFSQTLAIIFNSPQALSLDAFTGATPLEVLKHKGSLTTEEIWRSSDVLSQAVFAWYGVSAAWLMGGIFLIYRKIMTWHAPLSMLVTLFILASLFYGGDPSNFADPFVHLGVGATMMGAFFIATDPVSGATSNKGKIVFGIGLGILIYVIRTWGNYPDAVAFAVLLMNLSAPFIDQYTQPRSYGHKQSTSTRGGSR
ncbi:electron transport complex subunit RsxD [Nitrincola tibetensis]|uniref:Ion-translocating oxidoreductase complex subunit D n=1 Tax=Nitrincola tibetensis TaxID=2219697 RepID=A0A364NI73_9GAMM|nr:electron transport complex subunit RsxD [Nitrincola tibetensis]RAU16730.1 electron transport complex subunit RsxD [Nitrincola tibetensis]